MRKFLKENQKNPWFWIFVVLILVLGVALPLMSLSAGNSGDEDGFQWPYAEEIYNYYATGGQDTTCLQNEDMGMHGGFFDQMTYAMVKWFHVDNYSQLRHVMNSLFGWICILYMGLLVAAIAGWRAGVFTILLLFLSPRFLGHSFNNPKDLIFASMFAVSIYYCYRLISQYPKPKISASILLAIFAALAVVSRFAGYLVFAYLVLFLILYHIIKTKKQCLNKDSLKTIGRYVLYVAGIGILTFGITIALWPYIMSSPIKTTLDIVSGMSQYSVSLRQLFDGVLQWSDALPWFYTPKLILMTIPVAVIIGLILFFVFCWRKKDDRFWAFFILFTFLFPIFWIVVTHANVYGGWRHALFAYPTMVAAAGWGFDAMLKWVENKLEARAAKKDPSTQPESRRGVVVDVVGTAVLLLLLVGPIRHIVANHPYEYVYFNELSGGVKKAFGNYELDYYYNSTREATEWVLQNAEPKADGSKTIVGTWHSASVSYFLRNDTAHFQPRFVRWYELDNSDWDYAVFTITGINPKYLRSKYFPPKNTIKTIEVDGVPIALILKRTEKFSAKAAEFKNKNQLDSAAMYYHKALDVNPDNYIALFNLGEVFVRANRPDSAIFYTNRALEIDPEAEAPKLIQCYALAGQNKLDDALNLLHKINKYNPKYTQAHQLAVRIYINQKDFISAKKEMQKIIDHDMVDQASMNLWLECEAQQGINPQQSTKNLYKAMIKSMESRGRYRDAEKIRKQMKK
ncbi:MAG: hypothetical protein K6A41_06270 [Bacteroidales bacterium]|nr:hypothetical protein [Bacteroidales bacterium]